MADIQTNQPLDYEQKLRGLLEILQQQPDAATMGDYGANPVSSFLYNMAAGLSKNGNEMLLAVPKMAEAARQKQIANTVAATEIVGKLKDLTEQRNARTALMSALPPEIAAKIQGSDIPLRDMESIVNTARIQKNDLDKKASSEAYAKAIRGDESPENIAKMTGEHLAAYSNMQDRKAMIPLRQAQISQAIIASRESALRTSLLTRQMEENKLAASAMKPELLSTVDNLINQLPEDNPRKAALVAQKGIIEKSTDPETIQRTFSSVNNHAKEMDKEATVLAERQASEYTKELSKTNAMANHNEKILNDNYGKFAEKNSMFARAVDSSERAAALSKVKGTAEDQNRIADEHNTNLLRSMDFMNQTGGKGKVEGTFLPYYQVNKEGDLLRINPGTEQGKANLLGYMMERNPSTVKPLLDSLGISLEPVKGGGYTIKQPTQQPTKPATPNPAYPDPTLNQVGKYLMGGR